MKHLENNNKMIIIKEFHDTSVEEFMIPVIGSKYDMLIKDGDIDFYVDGRLVDSWTITENALITPPVLKRRGLLGKLADNMVAHIVERFEVDDSDLATWFMDRLLFAVLKIMFLRKKEEK